MSDAKSKYHWRRPLLAHLKGRDVLDVDELSLFEWYAQENATTIERMLSKERAVTQQQGLDLADSSGMQTVEYFIKRARYAEIIYMVSLLETYLAKACERLTTILPDRHNIFRPEELAGSARTQRRRFLKKYGRFKFPEDAWSCLGLLNDVRNILAHENGEPSSISDDVRNRIERSPGIRVVTRGHPKRAQGQGCVQFELVIEREFVDHCLSAFRSLVTCIDKQLDDVINRSLQPR